MLPRVRRLTLSKGGGASRAAQLLADYASGFAFSALDMSAIVKGHTSNFNGNANDLLTYASPSTKYVRNSAGVLVPGTTLRLDHNAAGVPLGIRIEEQRTNLVLNSDALSTQSVTVTAVAHTLSFYGTGTVTLSGASTAGPLVGTGAADRVSLTFTPSAGSLTLTVSGSVEFAQLEAGSLATSYIKTVGSQVTRAADNITLATSLMPFSATEGALVVDYVTPAVINPTRVAVNLSDGTGNERFTLGVTNAVQELAIVDGGAVVAGISGPAGVGSTAYKRAIAWQVNDAVQYINGAQAGTPDTSLTLPTVTSLRFGSFTTAGFHLNGHIGSLVYIPQRLPNATLQALSA